MNFDVIGMQRHAIKLKEYMGQPLTPNDNKCLALYDRIVRLAGKKDQDYARESRILEKEVAKYCKDNGLKSAAELAGRVIARR